MAALRTADSLGIPALLSRTEWRRARLAILCYHGISQEDEHEWNPGLYIPPEMLRRRMQTLVDCGCTVLCLDDALRRLYDRTLPDRAVVLTVDDGSYDFYRLGFPVIREFGFPVTLYLTTYYCEYNRPVFDTMCSYLLWKGRSRGAFSWPGVLPAAVDLQHEGWREAARRLRAYTLERRLSGRDKDSLLAELAALLGIDYKELCRKRLLHLVTPGEAREMVAQGIDIQYHTHRHRVYRSQARFHRELDDNARAIAAVTQSTPRHFCYTGGVYLPQHPEILKAYGLRSATTCDAGLCTPESNPMLLPRYLDWTGVTDREFRAWITGLAAFLPSRRTAPSEGQIGEEDDSAPATSCSAVGADGNL